jgi:hypothetical protein
MYARVVDDADATEFRNGGITTTTTTTTTEHELRRRVEPRG